MSIFNEDISINSLFGPLSVIHGDIKINGFAKIDGDIDGNLETTSNLIIGEKARIQGNITAKSVTVGGIVKGDITVTDSVELLSTSVVLGDIIARHIKAEADVILHGRCISLSKDEEFTAASEKLLNVKAIAERTLLNIPKYNSKEVPAKNSEILHDGSEQHQQELKSNFVPINLGSKQEPKS